MTRVVRIAGYAVLTAWLIFAAWYALSPAPPAEFTNDLGADILTVGRMGASATSPGAIAQMLSWQTWYDNATFVYAPMGQYAIALPIELIARDPFRTIKLLQVAQLSVACWGAAWLFTTMFGATRWRWFAGAAYALVPLTSFDVRGNSGFGWVAALMPVVLAFGVWLGRRYGPRALPLTGVLCGVATSSFSVEHGIIVGIPLVLISIALYRRDGIALPWWSAGGALLGFVVYPAYVVCATLFAAHLFAWDASDLLRFHTSEDLGTFSQGIAEQLAGILRESLLSANPLKNASTSMPFALLAGTVLWVLTLTAVVIAVRAGLWRRWLPIALIGAGCALLAFGTNLPGIGALLWDGLAWVPVVDAIRTPDRFAQIDALLLALAAAYGARALARVATPARIASALCAAAVLLAYLVVDAREHVLGFGDLDLRLPAFDRIDAASREAGGRTAVFALPYRGAMFDYPPYALRSPAVSFAWDIYGRYADGDAGVPLLRRAAVKTIATTPSWIAVDPPPGVPADFATPVARSPYARSVFAIAQGPQFFAIDRPRELVEPEYPVCTFAGPAAFELAAGDPLLDDAALIHDERPGCVRSVLADYDPLDAALPGAAIATWSGVGAFGLGYPLGTPNLFQVDRFSLATPWFRDAYLGDSILSHEPFATGDDAVSVPLNVTIAKPGRYAAYVRASGFARLRVLCDGSVTAVATSSRTTGFAWVALPLGSLATGAHAVRIEMNRSGAFNDAFVVDTVLVAPQGVSDVPARADAIDLSARSFAPPLDLNTVTGWTTLFPWSHSGQPLPPGGVTLRGTQSVVPGDTPELRSDAPDEPIDFRWNGPPGRYLFSAAGGLGAPYSTMTVSAGGRQYTARYDEGLPVGLYGILDLRRGDTIRVSLRSWEVSEKLLEHLILVPVSTYEPPTNYDTSGEQWRFDALARPIAFVEAAHSDGVLVRDGELRAARGATASIPIRPAMRAGFVTALVALPTPIPAAPGAAPAPAKTAEPESDGVAELRCGNRVDRDALGSGTANEHLVRLGVKRTGDGPCTLRLTWSGANFTVRSVDLHAFGGVLEAWNARESFPPGLYAWRSGSGPIPHLEIDGRPWRSGQLRWLAGAHLLTLASAAPPVPEVRIERAGSWPIPPSTPRGTLELAQLNDGNWFAQDGTTRVAGYDCDLVNTCFDASGTANVGRSLPKALALGLVITALDVLAAAAFAICVPRLGRLDGVSP